nr:hypothetical protein [Tanacetum cinerariifolium]
MMKAGFLDSGGRGEKKKKKKRWSPSISLFKEELSHVPVWVKFHDVSWVAYISNGLSLMARKTVRVVPNLKGNIYTKETSRIEYEWKPPRCSTCLIYGHLLVDYPKVAPKRVVDIMDKGKGQTSRDDDEGFIEVKKKNYGGNNGGNKKFVYVPKGCLDTFKTTSGRIQFLCDKLVSWSSKKHDCTTLQTAEA